MLRHSISQIFSPLPINLPDHTSHQGNAVFSSLQPHLPAQLPQAALNHQPAQAFSTTPSNFQPRSQIEAMPPVLRQLPLHQGPGGPAYDASVRHPVFFTDRLRKAPNGVGAGNGDGSSRGWGSPVAVGYVFNDGPKRKGGSRL